MTYFCIEVRDKGMSGHWVRAARIYHTATGVLAALDKFQGCPEEGCEYRAIKVTEELVRQ